MHNAQNITAKFPRYMQSDKKRDWEQCRRMADKGSMEEALDADEAGGVIMTKMIFHDLWNFRAYQCGGMWHIFLQIQGKGCCEVVTNSYKDSDYTRQKSIVGKSCRRGDWYGECRVGRTTLDSEQEWKKYTYIFCSRNILRLESRK